MQYQFPPRAAVFAQYLKVESLLDSAIGTARQYHEICTFRIRKLGQARFENRKVKVHKSGFCREIAVLQH